MKIYVGVTPEKREVFRSATEPTEKSHGEIYNCCIGPFRTIRGAKAMVHYGEGNPHISTVDEAEIIGKKYADDLAMEGLRRFTSEAAKEKDRLLSAARQALHR